MSNTKNTKTTEESKKQPNALLTFAGEQDVEFFGAACKAVADLSQEDSGGSREISIRAEGGHIVIGYKKELDV